MPQPSNAMLNRLRAMADRADKGEDANPQDYSGGNFDDAWSGGEQDGETHLAREILEDLARGE